MSITLPLSSIPEFSMKPGETIVRRTLHDRFGGGRQGGISPSRVSPNIFIFTAASGMQHGYADGWKDDACFHYTGEGQYGDQRMVRGNDAILNHVRRGRKLRLFKGAGGPVTYEGEFE